MALSATFNSTTGHIDVTWTEMEMSSFYLCWSDIQTEDYASLISAGDFLTVYNNNGSWTDETPPSPGSDRIYYAVNIYDYSFLASALCTVPESSITAPTDFTATLSGSNVLLQFTLPDNLPDGTSLQWQHSTTDPESGSPDWTTIATTNTNGVTL